jgi:hypothetical protein
MNMICQECGRKLNIEESEVCFSCKELEILANKAILQQSKAVKYARELATEMRATKETVGDWNGLEEAAAKAMNTVFDYLVEAIEITTARSSIPLDEDIIRMIFIMTEDQWLDDRGLLLVPKKTMRAYAMNIFKRFI